MLISRGSCIHIKVSLVEVSLLQGYPYIMYSPVVVFVQLLWFSLASVSRVWPIEREVEPVDITFLLHMDSCTRG